MSSPQIIQTFLFPQFKDVAMIPLASAVCFNKTHPFAMQFCTVNLQTVCDRLCGLVVRVSGYRYREVPGSIPGYQIF